MAPIALGSKHQDLLKAYFEVSKSEKPDWNSIALKADFATPKYARDQFAIVKKKLLAAPNGEPIELSDSHSTLLQAVVGVLKADVSFALDSPSIIPWLINNTFTDGLGQGGDCG
jgi:predicted tellurium resistance membrane protein TerC